MTTVDVYIGNGKYITFDQEQLGDFIKVYKDAKAKEQTSFIFENEEIQMPYATYVIEFVKSQLIQ